MILVVGIPCGGTSLVAGILHHLGVDMGDIATAEQSASHDKPYLKYECQRLLRLMREANGSVDRIHDAFKAYCSGRDGLCGVKNFTVNRLALYPHSLDDIDFVTVHAKRDIEECLMSDIKWRGWDLSRGEAMGRMHMTMRKMLIERPPVAVAEYERLLADPVEETRRLAADIGLEWRPEAASFVDPETKGLLSERKVQ